jgi:hypothetical protein
MYMYAMYIYGSPPIKFLLVSVQLEGGPLELGEPGANFKMVNLGQTLLKWSILAKHF